jgi:hypothetical protein
MTKTPVLGLDVSLVGGGEQLRHSIEKNFALVDQAFDTTVAAATRSGGALGIWRPNPMPAANGAPGDVADHNNWMPDDYIENLWEVLRAQHPDYISRTLLGKDQSDTFDMWRYVFEPPSPTKTLLLSCNVHGFERLSQTGTLLFLREVANNWQSDPALAYMRWNVRIVIVPIVNPWGLSQRPTVRWNSRLVDLNRNYDYRWAEWTVANPSVTGSKGDAPFSEAETQYLRDMLDDYPDAVAWFDMHDVNGPSPSQAEGEPQVSHIFYAANPLNSGAGQNIAVEVFEAVKLDGDRLLCFGEAPQPSAANYSTSRGLIGGTPEATTDGSSNTRWTSLATTRAVKFWGNIFIRAAQTERPSTKVSAPFVMQGRWGAGGGDANITTNSTTYVDIPALDMVRRIHGSGIIEFDGQITVITSGAGTGNPARIFVCPKLGIEQNPVSVASSANSSMWENYTDIISGRAGTINFKAVIPVAGNNGPVSGLPQLRAGFFWRTDASTPGTVLQLTRYQATLKFTPSDHVAKFEYYRATGFVSEGLGAMKQIYPYPVA